MPNVTNFSVVLVEPKYEGNVGAVARSMMNFGFNSLYLVNPCKLDDECYKRAVHAQSILDNAEIVDSLDEIIQDFDYLVATSSISSEMEKKHLRNVVFLKNFAKRIFKVKGRIGLLFGREDYGLYNNEIARCDMLVKIPSSEKYPSLNLSHAVSMVLYELYVHESFSPENRREISGLEKEKMNSFFSSLLDQIEFPEHKKEKTKIVFRRLIGRAMPSKWEYHRLMGVLSQTLKRLKKKKK